MKNISKQTIYYISLTFVISFTLGIFFDHYILHKSVEIEQNPIQDVGLEVQKNKPKDKTYTTETGCSIYVDVGGSVKSPGVFCLDSGAMVIDAVNKAGGFSKDSANRFITRNINLAQPLINNQKIYFPFQEELICQFQTPKEPTKQTEPITQLPTIPPYTDIDQTTTTTTDTNTSNANNTSNTQCVNINTATKEQLVTLNGVGESTAEKIIQGRPYTVVDDLLNVAGIGESTLEKFRSEVCI